jgi:hypothetical protein
MFSFVLWSVPVFYHTSRSHQNSNLFWTQISLQIIKRFEKEKDFPSSYLATGQNPAGIWIRPSRPILSPSPFFLFFMQPSRASLARLHFGISPTGMCCRHHAQPNWGPPWPSRRTGHQTIVPPTPPHPCGRLTTTSCPRWEPGGGRNWAGLHPRQQESGPKPRQEIPFAKSEWTSSIWSSNSR